MSKLDVSISPNKRRKLIFVFDLCAYSKYLFRSDVRIVNVVISVSDPHPFYADPDLT